MLLPTVISPINFTEQFLIQHCSISVNSFSSVWKWGYPNFPQAAALNQRGHSVIKFSQNDQNLHPPPPCLQLFDFGNRPFCERPLPFQHHHYPIGKSCYFIDSYTPVIISSYKCYKKYSHDMNVPSIIINTNGFNIKASAWVNYTRDLGSLLSFSGLQYRKK